MTDNNGTHILEQKLNMVIAGFRLERKNGFDYKSTQCTLK